jgi:cell division protease FtsH
MVCEYGMSRLGPLTYGKKEEQIFLGREIAQHRDFSDDTAKQIDSEVRGFVDAGYNSAYELLQENTEPMHRIAQALLDRETLDANELKLLIEGQDLPPIKVHASGDGDDSGHVPQVLKPEGARAPGFTGSNAPSPA